MKRTTLLIALIAILLVGVVLAADFWEKKPYNQWKEKDCLKMLESSPWVYDFRLARMGDIGANVRGPKPPQTTTTGDSGSSGSSGEFDYERESVTIIRIALFSSHPIRQAYVAIAAKGDAGRIQKMKDFATRDAGDEIVLAWTLDSRPKRNESVQLLDKQLRTLTLGELKNDTYLATDDGRKVFLKDYIPPTPDGTGAKFVFPRTLEDGSPLITPDVKSFKFQTIQFHFKDEDVAVDATFKVDKLMYNGQLDY
jgi:hypothetical protein